MNNERSAMKKQLLSLLTSNFRSNLPKMLVAMKICPNVFEFSKEKTIKLFNDLNDTDFTIEEIDQYLLLK